MVPPSGALLSVTVMPCRAARWAAVNKPTGRAAAASATDGWASRQLSCVNCSRGHARATVNNFDQRAAAARRVPGHDDLGRAWRKTGGVLQQLGEQVHDVGRGAATDRDTFLDAQDDPVVLLDLGDRAPEHVHQGERLGRVTWCLVAGEDERAV